MTSLDFNYAEPIASSDSASDSDMDSTPERVGVIHKSDYVVLNGRPVKIVEVSHSKPGKHGHAKVHLVGIDIFTSRRYEDVRPVGHMIQVPNIQKKEYTIIELNGCDSITLRDDITGKTRNDLKLKEDWDITARILDKYNQGKGRIKVTVFKALGEDQIKTFKVIE
ncbi:unnamed protein product [Adineta steineri]|uniref:Eukaryotic translation initiation factor 5A n=1 Tax=Adineta steineri TaxID=433720 RepID=A0A816ELE8_9BILA|nr:unnamed protein product [Adineta steineri]CAF1651148.1 unnamed protein product [Adineta steineri]